MTKPLKILIIAGARPNFMKVAPLIRSIQEHELSSSKALLTYRLVHTGQHYDAKMSDVFFKELGIPAPDINLEVGSGSHAVQTANVMIRFEAVCEQEKPDWIIVVGDVNSTLACTLVGAKAGIKVAHVEAGLRSFDRNMPEEINRLVTDALADLLLTPSEDADANLRREGVPESKIRCIGNIMIDSLVANLPQARASTVLSRLSVEKERYVFVTLHRPSNVDQHDSLTSIFSEFQRLSSEYPIVFPIHPRTLKMSRQFGISLEGNPRIHLVDPIGYHDSLALTESARFVLTDSGGLQEESTYFRTPCLTLRPNTERPVTISIGSNKLTTVSNLNADIRTVLSRPSRFGAVPPLWDGKAAGRVVAAIKEVSNA